MKADKQQLAVVRAIYNAYDEDASYGSDAVAASLTVGDLAALAPTAWLDPFVLRVMQSSGYPLDNAWS